MRLSLLGSVVVLGACLAFADARLLGAAEPSERFAPLRIVETVASDNEPPLYLAYYSRPSGLEMLGPSGLSDDGGRNWKPFTATPDFSANLPYGYRREPHPGVLDPKTARILTVFNALDTPGVDPNIVEPPIAQNSYYLRYQVSNDGGRTHQFDEPIVQRGHTAGNPFEGVWIGKNGVYLGDLGSLPIVTKTGSILVPAQFTPLGPDGRPFSAGGLPSYTDVLVLIGAWTKDNRILWEISQRVEGDPKRTTRGLIEPTLAELPDGRILMVMRGSNGGSNDPHFELPSYQWRSVSDDGGRTWSKPEPCNYDSGNPFFSPSSMSQLLTHSSGRIFWIGNVSPTNCQGNTPRWPLVIGEVDTKTLGLIESSLLTIDSHQSDDPPELYLSHFRAIEDRETGEIILTVPRATTGYKTSKWGIYRLKV